MDFTEEDVRKKLREMGYVNVPQSTLQEFMSDLQDLVDHDEESISTVEEEKTNYFDDDDDDDYTVSSSKVDSSFRRKPFQDVAQRNHPVAFSREKVIGTSRHVVYDKENMQAQIEQDHSDFLSSTTSSYDERGFDKFSTRHSRREEKTDTSVKRKVARKRDGKTHVYDETFTDDDSIASDITELEDRLRNIPLHHCNHRNGSQSKTSSETRLRSNSDSRYHYPLPAFIRPSKSNPRTSKVQKCDPVSRYHQFNEEWKVNRFPGESKHSSVRWNVRAQMLNHEVFEKPRHRYTSNNYVVPTDKKRQALRWEVRSALAKT